MLFRSEYYSSIYSAFKLEDGHLLHKEDKSFFEKMMRVIDEYVENPELSVELLSASLGCSTRQFYRKLKNVTDKTPADIIKEYRLTVAERLLLTTNLTVEEIMNKAANLYIWIGLPLAPGGCCISPTALPSASIPPFM